MRTRLPAVVLCLGFLCCGCAAADATGVEEAKQFEGYRVYYAGETLAGLPLETAEGEDWKSDPEAVRWTFYYGHCDPPQGDGGCAPPVQIQNYSICRRWPGMFAGKAKTFDFRGARATRRRGRGLEVFTGSTAVVIYGTRGSLVRAAARNLRPVRDDRSAPLPPPAPGALQGKLPCQSGG